MADSSCHQDVPVDFDLGIRPRKLLRNQLGKAHNTAHMGPASDPMSVVDTQGRVKGVQGLRVVDASIFPVVPCANTNFPTLMAAEKIAEAITN